MFDCDHCAHSETAPKHCRGCVAGPERGSNWVPMAHAANARQVGGHHYKEMGVEPWDVIETWPREQRIGFWRGNALKYLMRMGAKDEQLTEAGKAQHYLQKLIEELERA